MKGFRFYAELDGLPARITVRKLEEMASAGQHVNCVALLLGREHRTLGGNQEAIAATFYHADSDTSLTAVCRGYLDTRTRRVSERLARLLHPKLFARLDAEEG